MILDLGQDTVRHASIDAAINELAASGGTESRGVIYTKTEVVNFILDLVGYTTDRPLHKLTLLEPSCGDGDFLVCVVDRLLQSWLSHGDITEPSELASAITTVEIHAKTCVETKKKIEAQLVTGGISKKQARALTQAWFINDDFLLTPFDHQFDFVVGNPPYVRQEEIPNTLLNVYRKKYRTMYDRADLYVPFIERSLDLLQNSGVLGFICADRWMKNKYGRPLRLKVDQSFHVRHHIDLTGAQPFHSDVTAYPAISIIAREVNGPTRVVSTADVSKDYLGKIVTSLRKKSVPKKYAIREITQITDGGEPWLLEYPDRVNLLRKLEAQFPLIEDTGCKVGIGVATGADKIFIGLYEDMPVESACKLPLATTKDLKSGDMQWSGLGVINPYMNEGGLVDLEEYPLLKKYLMERYHDIANRHCARSNQLQWYKTIDRIYPALAKRPKLLIPDINGKARIVLEDGKLYPHHNLYYIVSDAWDLKALQAVLLSKITQMVIGLYTTKMRGGYPRYQAQYLRRLRVPHWKDVPTDIRKKLAVAAESKDIEQCTRAACELYQLTPDNQVIVESVEER